MGEENLSPIRFTNIDDKGSRQKKLTFLGKPKRLKHRS